MVNITLCFGGAGIELQSYVDLDLAGDLDDRRSTMRYIFILGSASIRWVSRLQNIVALSITEAEYLIIIQVSKKII